VRDAGGRRVREARGPPRFPIKGNETGGGGEEEEEEEKEEEEEEEAAAVVGETRRS